MVATFLAEMDDVDLSLTWAESGTRAGAQQLFALTTSVTLRAIVSHFYFVADALLPAMNVAGEPLHNFLAGQTRVEILHLVRIGM